MKHFKRFAAAIAAAILAATSAASSFPFTSYAEGGSATVTIQQADNDTAEHTYAAIQLFTGDVDNETGKITEPAWAADFSSINNGSINTNNDGASIITYLKHLYWCTETKTNDDSTTNTKTYLYYDPVTSGGSSSSFSSLSINENGYNTYTDSSSSDGITKTYTCLFKDSFAYGDTDEKKSDSAAEAAVVLAGITGTGSALTSMDTTYTADYTADASVLAQCIGEWAYASYDNLGSNTTIFHTGSSTKQDNAISPASITLTDSGYYLFMDAKKNISSGSDSTDNKELYAETKYILRTVYVNEDYNTDETDNITINVKTSLPEVVKKVQENIKDVTGYTTSNYSGSGDTTETTLNPLELAVDSGHKDTYYYIKNDGTEETTQATDPSDNTPIELGYFNDVADYSMGDDVMFELIGTLPERYDDYQHYYYCFNDTLDKGLTLNNIDATDMSGGNNVGSIKVNTGKTTDNSSNFDLSNLTIWVGTKIKTSEESAAEEKYEIKWIPLNDLLYATDSEGSTNESPNYAYYNSQSGNTNEIKNIKNNTENINGIYTPAGAPQSYIINNMSSSNVPTNWNTDKPVINISADTTDNTGSTKLYIEFNDLRNFKRKIEESGNTSYEEIFNKDTLIRVTYTATLNQEAVVGLNGNVNTVNLTYSNNPNYTGTGSDDTTEKNTTNDSNEDSVIVFTYALQNTKVNSKGETLEGAQFTLWRYAKKFNGTYWQDNEEKKEYAVLNSEGKVVGWVNSPPTTTVSSSETGGGTTTTTVIAVEPTDSGCLNTSTDDNGNTTYTYSKDDMTTISNVTTILKSGADGKFTVTGLDDGKYYLQELIAPSSGNDNITYNLLNAPVLYVITADTENNQSWSNNASEALTELSLSVFMNEKDKAVIDEQVSEYSESDTVDATNETIKENNITYELKTGNAGKFIINVEESKSSGLLSAKIIDTSGTILPSTGGIGTKIFYIVGGILVVVTGVVLISRKRAKNED